MLNLFKLLFGNVKSPTSQSKSATKPNDVRESEWNRWEADTPSTLPEGFVKFSGATSVSVAGTSYRLDECKTVISALKGGRVDLTKVCLTRESDNSEDPNAIRVLVNLRHREFHIGYLPRDISDMISNNFSSDMPLQAILLEWGSKIAGNAVFFRVSVLVPVAKDRKKYIRKSDQT